MKIRSLLKLVTATSPHEPSDDNSPSLLSQPKTQNSEFKSPEMVMDQSDQTFSPAPSRFCDKDHRTNVGKIGRLPDTIRNQLNHRLLNGQSGVEILAWLNELPHVKKVLAAQFDGAPVNHQNLTKWRLVGYQRWLKKQEHLVQTKELAQYAVNLSHAGRGSLAGAAATIASARIFESLDALPDEKSTPEDLGKIAAAINPLLKAEQNIQRIGIAKQRVRQRDAQLLLMRDKHQRDVAAISLRVLGDARAKAIEASDCSYEEKIELIGHYLFDDLWDLRPTQPDPATP